jgi:hypothetical protein
VFDFREAWAALGLLSRGAGRGAAFDASGPSAFFRSAAHHEFTGWKGARGTHSSASQSAAHHEFTGWKGDTAAEVDLFSVALGGLGGMGCGAEEGDQEDRHAFDERSRERFHEWRSG